MNRRSFITRSLGILGTAALAPASLLACRTCSKLDGFPGWSPNKTKILAKKDGVLQWFNLADIVRWGPEALGIDSPTVTEQT